MINWTGIYESILGGIFSAIIIFLFGYFTALFITARKRFKRLKIFNFNHLSRSNTIPIYIAHLVVPKGGVLLTNGTPSLHFEGSAVPIKEVNAARKLENAIQSSFYKSTPKSIRRILFSFSNGFINLKFSIEPAPLCTKEVNKQPVIITIGGPEFNSVTKFFLEKAPYYKIKEPEDCIYSKIECQNQFGGIDHITPDSEEKNIGLIQKCSFNGSKVLILSGIGTNGTLAAVEWFLDHWDNLANKLSDDDFGVCLQCRKRTIDPDGYKNPEFRSEYPPGIWTSTKSK